MRADFPVVLDACVLAPYSLCDLLLRLAETPRLFLPVWSDYILNEVQRVQQNKLKPSWPKEQSDRWRNAVEVAFPEAKIADYQSLISVMEINAKDQHVLAVAVKARAGLIVTFNLKDFPKVSLEKWGLQAIHPQDYLVTLYEMAPDVVVSKLEAIARDRNRTLKEILKHWVKVIPAFSEHVAEALSLDLD